MKGLKLLLLSFCVAFAACSVQSPSVQVSDKGTKWSWDKGTIVVETPERPAGQTSVIGLTAPKIEAVRVGFVGLGMRGPSAVERFTYIPGVEIVALCDYEQSIPVRKGMKNYASVTILTWFILLLIGCIIFL